MTHRLVLAAAFVLVVAVLPALGGCGSAESGPPAPAPCEGDVTITRSSELSAFVSRRCSSVTGSLEFRTTIGSGEADVATVDLPLLTDVGGNLRFWGNYGLLAVSMPELTAVGGELDLDTNPHLSSLGLPRLATARALAVVRTEDLVSFSLPALTTVDGVLEVISNFALADFTLAPLTTLGGPLYVQNNPSLPECQALAFKDHLVAAHGFTGDWYVSGNDTNATCP